MFCWACWSRDAFDEHHIFRFNLMVCVFFFNVKLIDLDIPGKQKDKDMESGVLYGLVLLNRFDSSIYSSNHIPYPGIG